MADLMDQSAWSRNAFFLDKLCSVGRLLSLWQKVCIPPAKMVEGKQFDEATDVCAQLEKELARVRKLCVGSLMKPTIAYIDSIEGECASYAKNLMTVRSTKRKAWSDIAPILLLKRKDISAAFAKYCKAERSTENLEVYKMFEKGLKAKDMQNIWLNYIKTGDVNVAGSTVRALRQAAELAERTGNIAEYAGANWKDVRADVMTNLSDTLIRFKKAQEESCYALV